MVKENIDRERPTQGGENGRIVGLLRGMRGNKRGARRKKTYVEIGNWQVSRSYEENDRKKTRGQEEKDLHKLRKQVAW